MARVKRIHPRCNNLCMNTAFFLIHRYMILLNQKRFRKERKKKGEDEEEEKEEEKEEEEARSRPMDHRSHESGNAWKEGRLQPRTASFETDWNGKGHGRGVVWLVTKLEEGVGYTLPTIKAR